MSLFEKLTDGLRLYEIVLLLLGMIMFLALVVLLIVYASQRRTIKPLFIFFAIPLLMLVWPSIQKIKVDGTGAEIEKQVAEVQKDPTEANKDKLNELLSQVDKRNIKNPETLKNVVVGHYILGNETAANDVIENLPADAKNDPKVVEVRKSIALSNQLKTQLSAVQQNPADSAKVKELDRLQQQATTLSVKNPALLQNVAVAQFLVGKTSAAEKTISTLPPKEAAAPAIKNVRTSIAVTTQLKSQINTVNENPRDSNQIKELNRLQLEASKLQVKNTETAKSITTAKAQVTEYKRINPRLRIVTTPQQ